MKRKEALHHMEKCREIFEREAIHAIKRENMDGEELEYPQAVKEFWLALDPGIKKTVIEYVPKLFKDREEAKEWSKWQQARYLYMAITDVLVTIGVLPWREGNALS